MYFPTVDALIAALKDWHVLAGNQLFEANRVLRQRYSNPELLLNYMRQLGWLTQYQFDRVREGDRSGLLFEHYALTDRLGAGGVAQVYKARDVRTAHVVALKLIHEAHLSNPEILARFSREIQIASHLDHPNIVKAFDAAVCDKWGYLAMEFVDGIDLERWPTERGRLNVGGACDFVRQACLGLQHAHDAGLVHRDVKPANLLVSAERAGVGFYAPYGVLKLLDLGLARFHGTAGGVGVSLTAEGATLGTPDYMAPEQARNPRSVDCRADVYSLGCTFYSFLTGQVPFPGGTVMTKLFRHQRETPLPPRQLDPKVPAEVSDVVMTMIAKSPDDRYSRIDEVAKLLRPFC